MALPNVAEQEFTRAFYYGWYGDCIDGLPPIENGMIRVSGEAGLGVRLKVDTEGADNAVSCTTSQG